MAKFRTGDIPQFKDVNDVASYLYQMQEQLGYILNHLETDNLTEDTLNTLTAQKTLADLNGMPADTKINGLDGVLNVSSGGTGRSELTENKLLYGAGTEIPYSLGFPSVAGSFLRQDTSGAPYWSNLPTLTASYCVATYNQSQTIRTSNTKVKFNSFWNKHDPYSIFSLSTYGVTVAKSGIYAVSLYVDLQDAKSGVVYISRNGSAINLHNVYNGRDIFFPELFLNFVAGETVGYTMSASSTATVGDGIFSLRMNIKFIGN